MYLCIIRACWKPGDWDDDATHTFGAPFETSDGVFILCDIICTRDARPNGSSPEKRAATHESCRRTRCAEYSMSDANRTNPIFLRPVSSSNKHNHDRTRRLRQERGTTKPDLKSMLPYQESTAAVPAKNGVLQEPADKTAISANDRYTPYRK